MSDYFLGFDLSTQQLKIIVTNEQLKHINTYNIEFDKVYREKYNINKGVVVNGDEIVSPVAMWLDSIDYLFNKMKEDGFKFLNVRGISGSAQQHGSVYWSKESINVLSNLKIEKNLSEQLKDAFSLPNSPNWQDHSTGKEIKEFEEAVGCPEKLANLTGSKAHYRFTGIQIRKLAKRENPKRYKETLRISLVSSFLSSILLGKITGIEEADACGMNLYDIKNNDYNEELLGLAAGVHPVLDNSTKEEFKSGIRELREKLGNINPISYKNLGNISSYFVNKYGFNSNTKIYSFTGDNLATIISLPLAANDCLISLGTSTTVLIVTESYNSSSQYHLFKHPTLPNKYMGMICYCNGGLAREKIRDVVNEKYNLPKSSWNKFNEILNESITFDNKLGIYFPLGEIVPNASAQIKRAKVDENGRIEYVEEWEVDEDVSSIIESQTLSCRLRTGPMLSKSNDSDTPKEYADHLHEIYDEIIKKFGELYTDHRIQTFESLMSRPNKCYYVGGASSNLSILKKMSSIFGAVNGNYKVEISNSCALGGAYKASWSYKCEISDKWIDYNDYINSLFPCDGLYEFKTDDHWEDYFNGIGLLAKMEQNLKLD